MSFAKSYLAEIFPTLDEADRCMVADAAPVSFVAEIGIIDDEHRPAWSALVA